ncbi:SAM-dependent methyltransferase [Vibrio splendidus]|uniref:SAM-dependent methyltransferase n=2 Tax=Vibrio splendidus TaxID=29497 RepID=UPI000C8629E9|nr:SAM-dependent methyltransferase [Vibrio splendidus]PMO03193.1 hypothetical protein BCT19_18485 [Vibrio splendidus]
MVPNNFFFNYKIFKKYIQLIIINQLKGNELLVCCFDTGKYYDSYSLSILHSYYEWKSKMLLVGGCRIISLVNNYNFRQVNCKGNFKENKFSSTKGSLTEFLEANKLKIIPNRFTLTSLVQNKITFNNYKDINIEFFFNRLDAIVIASLTDEYQSIIKNHAQDLLSPNGFVFICDNSDDIELKGMQRLTKGVYTRLT